MRRTNRFVCSQHRTIPSEHILAREFNQTMSQRNLSPYLRNEFVTVSGVQCALQLLTIVGQLMLLFGLILLTVVIILANCSANPQKRIQWLQHITIVRFNFVNQIMAHWIERTRVVASCVVQKTLTNVIWIQEISLRNSAKFRIYSIELAIQTCFETICLARQNESQSNNFATRIHSLIWP